MRRTVHPSFAAGCGQLFLARRDAYFESGGHGAIRASRHDGIELPAAFRRAGFRTDLCDATQIACCRMYRGARQVWDGLLKNASEGLGAPKRIVPFTVLLMGGQVAAPVLAAILAPVWVAPAVCAVFGPRVVAAFRFRQPLSSAVLHPARRVGFVGGAVARALVVVAGPAGDVAGQGLSRRWRLNGFGYDGGGRRS